MFFCFATMIPQGGRYENYSKWLRNRLILKGMRNSRFAQWGRFTEAQILEKITNIDKARVIAQKHEFLDSFEYSFTFTYDNAKNTEKTFKKGLLKCLRQLERKHGWRYVGIWQRGKNNKRLYLQALVKTGNGEIIGGVEKVRDFQMRGKWMKSTTQSVYFNERFGRTSVEKLSKERMEHYRHHVGSFLEVFNKEKAETIASRKTPYQLLKGLSTKFIK